MEAVIDSWPHLTSRPTVPRLLPSCPYRTLGERCWQVWLQMQDPKDKTDKTGRIVGKL